jgi:replicative superfamily II helicase
MDCISFVNTQVAQFLRVNPEAGLFFFDSSYRPVPLAQQYIGISEQNFLARNELLNEICYKKVSAFHLGSRVCNLLEWQFISL